MMLDRDKLRTCAALIKALIAGDENARGPLADWIEEYGCPNVESPFIRLHTARAIDALRNGWPITKVDYSVAEPYKYSPRIGNGQVWYRLGIFPADIWSTTVTLLDYANARINVVLFWAGVGCPGGNSDLLTCTWRVWRAGGRLTRPTANRGAIPRGSKRTRRPPMENSKIEWTDHTFNPWRGCTKISSGCLNCYAETQSKRNPGVLGQWGPEGTRVVASEAKWAEPLKWNRQAAERHANWRRAAMMQRSEYDGPDPWERPRVFCASMADVFEEWSGPMHASNGNPLWWCFGSLSNSPHPSDFDTRAGCRVATMADIRERLFQTIGDTPHLDWLLLTKRPENAVRMTDRWPANVWLGVSVEDQAAANERIPVLLTIPAKVRFLSCEPLLGPVDLSHIRIPLAGDSYMTRSALRGTDGLNRGKETPGRDKRIDWVIAGGESGNGARPCRVEWIQLLVEQCRAANVACFVKQLGARTEVEDPLAVLRAQPIGMPGCGPRTWVPLPLRDFKGGDPDEWPADLRVRQFPEVAP